MLFLLVAASVVDDNSTEVLWIDAPSMLIDCGGTTWQPMRMIIRHVGPPIATSIRLTGEPVPLAQPLTLETGTREYGLIMPPVKKERDATLSIVAGGKTLASHKVTVKAGAHLDHLSDFPRPHRHRLHATCSR